LPGSKTAQWDISTGSLAHEVEAHAAEEAFVEPRMAEGAGYDEIGVLGV
jgi:hypothetical protein